MLTLVQTFKLNGVDRQARVADVLAQIVEVEITIPRGAAVVMELEERSEVAATGRQASTHQRPVVTHRVAILA